LLEASPLSAARFAEFHPEAIFSAPEAEFAEQIVRRAPFWIWHRRAGARA
jgi:hypothetical protein